MLIVLLYIQYLNVKLTDINVPEPDKYPHMVSHTYTQYRSHGVYTVLMFYWG